MDTTNEEEKATGEQEDEESEKLTEAEAERQRRERFIAWACTLQDVSGNDFEDLVKVVSEKHNNLATKIAQGITVPGTYNGGKRALKREARHKLPKIVKSFDPDAGEHFNQYVTRELGAMLEAEVQP